MISLVLLEGGRIFNRWDLVEGSEIIGVMSLKKILGTHLLYFLSLCFLASMR
jgi:hypothetical protein